MGFIGDLLKKNRATLVKNPRMRMMVQQLDKIQDNRKRIISYRAEDFLKTKTALADSTSTGVELD